MLFPRLALGKRGVPAAHSCCYYQHVGLSFAVAAQRRGGSEAEKMKVLIVAGARPNFMKVAPLIREFRKHPEVSVLLVHTGQHYDPNLSDVFFTELDIPQPDVHLEVGSGSHAAQTASVMMKIEPVMAEFLPDVVVVVGDVNSTMAASLTAAKLAIPAAHVEAGLRSFDRSMPAEINPAVTDYLA